MSESQAAKDAKGIVLVFMERGEKVDEETFHDWYDNEHGPQRLTLPGFLTANRYKAADDQKPSWLTVYNLTTPELGDSPEFMALMANASDREKEIFQNLEGSQRSIYSLIPGSSAVNEDKASYPTKYVFLVSMEVNPEDEEEYHKWYNEEHMELLLKVPGWIRARRYKAESFRKFGNPGKDPLKFLAVHEIESGDALTTAEFKAAATPWKERLIAKAKDRVARVFEHYKTFEKPE